jgi:asparagine synthase (glutamine-hydrolysing)
VKAAARLSPLEAVVDTPIGERPAPPLAGCDPALSPLAALERALLPALTNPPCLVDFSGGRDSSAVLAVAVGVARREGLPLPIASTDRFRGHPEADENRWQEMVIRHLRLPDWQRRTFGGELELIGPVAQRVMKRHGLVSPSMVYAVVPALEDAAGGTAVTGLEGDGLFGGWTYARAWSVLSGWARPEPRDLLRLARLSAPGPLRARMLRRRYSLDAPWVLPEPRMALERALTAHMSGEPRRWDLRVGWWSRSAMLGMIQEAFELLAADAGTRVVHPLLDPTFLASMARAGGRRGFGSRTRAMQVIFGRLLPEELPRRPDKADFTYVYFGEQSKEFAASWRGDGVPDHLVDADALRATWSFEKPEWPDMRSALLLQAAWLAESGARESQSHFNCDLD